MHIRSIIVMASFLMVSGGPMFGAAEEKPKENLSKEAVVSPEAAPKELMLPLLINGEIRVVKYAFGKGGGRLIMQSLYDVPFWR
jgi:hypothetical protein